MGSLPTSKTRRFSAKRPSSRTEKTENISNLWRRKDTGLSGACVCAARFQAYYFMDKIDAALDFPNVSIVANYIKDRTKNAQFVIISLSFVSFFVSFAILAYRDRNDMFELSYRLIWIHKTGDATQSIAIDNRALVLTKTMTASASAT